MRLYGTTRSNSGRSILDLDESTVGEYLELCQRGLLKPETLRSGMDGEDSQMGQIINPKWADQRTLELFFPLKSGRVGASSRKPAIERPQGDQRAPRVGVSMEEGADGERHEPGEAYRVYRSRDVLGVLPEELGLVISYGSRWIGVDQETTLRVTERYERRLSTWVGRQTRQEGIEGRRRSG